LNKSPFVNLTLSDDETEPTHTLPRDATKRLEKHNSDLRRPTAAEQEDDLCPQFDQGVSRGRSNLRKALSFHPGDGNLIPQLPVESDEAFAEAKSAQFKLFYTFLH
jgi:FAD/FMN-containing dehydrogenase